MINKLKYIFFIVFKWGENNHLIAEEGGLIVLKSVVVFIVIFKKYKQVLKPGDLFRTTTVNLTF